MTENKAFKQAVRDLARAERISYSEARRRLLAEEDSCHFCSAPARVRCCGLGSCAVHHAEHQALEHLAPDAGRYRAALTCSKKMLLPRHRLLPPVPGAHELWNLPWAVQEDPRPEDGLRIIAYIREVTTTPDGPDPIGSALLDHLAAGHRLPTPDQSIWLSADILSRCTWPALAQALGNLDTAEWLRRQPRVTGGGTTPLTERLHELSRGVFGIRYLLEEMPEPPPVAKVAATDALCRLGYLAFTDQTLENSHDVAGDVFTYLLTRPDGPERIGETVGRVQRDAIATVLTALGELSRAR